MCDGEGDGPGSGVTGPGGMGTMGGISPDVAVDTSSIGMSTADSTGMGIIGELATAVVSALAAAAATGLTGSPIAGGLAGKGVSAAINALSQTSVGQSVVDGIMSGNLAQDDAAAAVASAMQSGDIDVGAATNFVGGTTAMGKDSGNWLTGKTTAPSATSLSTMTPEQSALLKQLNELLGGKTGEGGEFIPGQLGQGVPAYEGKLTAGPTGMEEKGWGAISSLLSGPQQSATSKTAIDKILQGTAQGVQKYDVGEFDPAAIQSWYQDALVKPAMDTWEKSVVPQIQEKFIGQNAGSSGAANRAISGSAEDMMSNLNAQLATALYGEKGAFDTRKFTSETDYIKNLFSAGQNDATRAAQVPVMENASMENFMKAIGLGTSAGATERGIEQQGLNEEYMKWLSSQGYSNPYLSLLSSALGQRASENVVNPGSQQSGILQDVLAPAFGSYMGSESGSEAITNLFSKLFSEG